jgi:hypothetical protein
LEISIVTPKLLAAQVPSELMDDFRSLVVDYKQDFDTRDFDYFEYMDGNGNAIERYARGSHKHELALKHRGGLTLEAVADNDDGSSGHYELQYDDEEAEPLPWYEQLTGQQTATHCYPGWHFQTFRDAVEAEVREALELHFSSDDPDVDNGEEVYVLCVDIIPTIMEELELPEWHYDG